jgi:hypothetical protein
MKFRVCPLLRHIFVESRADSRRGPYLEKALCIAFKALPARSHSAISTPLMAVR